MPPPTGIIDPRDDFTLGFGMMVASILAVAVSLSVWMGGSILFPNHAQAFMAAGVITLLALAGLIATAAVRVYARVKVKSMRGRAPPP